MTLTIRDSALALLFMSSSWSVLSCVNEPGIKLSTDSASLRHLHQPCQTLQHKGTALVDNISLTCLTNNDNITLPETQSSTPSSIMSPVTKDMKERLRAFEVMLVSWNFLLELN